MMRSLMGAGPDAMAGRGSRLCEEPSRCAWNPSVRAGWVAFGNGVWRRVPCFGAVAGDALDKEGAAVGDNIDRSKWTEQDHQAEQLGR